MARPVSAMNEEQKAEARRLYLSGMNARAVARAVGCKYTSLHRFLTVSDLRKHEVRQAVLRERQPKRRVKGQGRGVVGASGRWRRETFAPEELAALKAVCARGGTLAEARKALPGRSEDAILRCVERNSLPVLTLPRPAEAAEEFRLKHERLRDEDYVRLLMAEGGHPRYATGRDGRLLPILVDAAGRPWKHTPKGSPGWPQLRPDGSAYPVERVA